MIVANLVTMVMNIGHESERRDKALNKKKLRLHRKPRVLTLSL